MISSTLAKEKEEEGNERETPSSSLFGNMALSVFNESLAARSRWQWQPSAVGVELASTALCGAYDGSPPPPLGSAIGTGIFSHFHREAKISQIFPDLLLAEDGAKLRMRMSTSQAPCLGNH